MLQGGAAGGALSTSELGHPGVLGPLASLSRVFCFIGLIESFASSV